MAGAVDGKQHAVSVAPQCFPGPMGMTSSKHLNGEIQVRMDINFLKLMHVQQMFR